MSLLLKFRSLLKGEICFVALCIAAGIFVGGALRYGCFTDFAKNIASRAQHIDSTCVPAVGITRSELLQRFDGVQLYILAEHDKTLGDVARWMYQVGDSDIYYTFVYSYDSGTIIEWRMQRDFGYYNYSFYDYLNPADIKSEPEQ